MCRKASDLAKICSILNNYPFHIDILIFFSAFRILQLRSLALSIHDTRSRFLSRGYFIVYLEFDTFAPMWSRVASFQGNIIFFLSSVLSLPKTQLSCHSSITLQISILPKCQQWESVSICQPPYEIMILPHLGRGFPTKYLIQKKLKKNNVIVSYYESINKLLFLREFMRHLLSGYKWYSWGFHHFPR